MHKQLHISIYTNNSLIHEQSRANHEVGVSCRKVHIQGGSNCSHLVKGPQGAPIIGTQFLSSWVDGKFQRTVGLKFMVITLSDAFRQRSTGTYRPIRQPAVLTSTPYGLPLMPPGIEGTVVCKGLCTVCISNNCRI